MSNFIIGPAGLINTDYITEVTPHGTEGWLAHMHDGNQHVLTNQQVAALVPGGIDAHWAADLRKRWNAQKV